MHILITCYNWVNILTLIYEWEVTVKPLTEGILNTLFKTLIFFCLTTISENCVSEFGKQTRTGFHPNEDFYLFHSFQENLWTVLSRLWYCPLISHHSSTIFCLIPCTTEETLSLKSAKYVCLLWILMITVVLMSYVCVSRNCATLDFSVWNCTCSR